ncbi:MAG: hypothetical protein KF752_01520 [Pirellulaceae bacterium]|nr:hypothetical protein [Pirellulaceae bacterium]
MVVRATTARPKPIKVRSGAKATARVKAAKPAPTSGVTATKPVRRRTKVETRTRVYWAVFNPDLKRVAVFEFDQRAEADKRAAKLTESSGGEHFVQKIKAIVQVEPQPA